MSIKLKPEELRPGDHVLHVLPFGPPTLCEVVKCFYFQAEVKSLRSGDVRQVSYENLRWPTPLELLALEAT